LPRQLFFAKAAPAATADDVRALFSRYGPVESVNLFRAWATARSSKGCGLIVMSSPRAAAAARAALNGVFTWEGADAPMAIEWCCPSKLGAKSAAAAATKAAAAAERTAAAAADRAAAAGKRRGSRGGRGAAPSCGGPSQSAPSALGAASSDTGSADHDPLAWLAELPLQQQQQQQPSQPQTPTPQQLRHLPHSLWQQQQHQQQQQQQQQQQRLYHHLQRHQGRERAELKAQPPTWPRAAVNSAPAPASIAGAGAGGAAAASAHLQLVYPVVYLSQQPAAASPPPPPQQQQQQQQLAPLCIGRDALSTDAAADAAAASAGALNSAGSLVAAHSGSGCGGGFYAAAAPVGPGANGLYDVLGQLAGLRLAGLCLAESAPQLSRPAGAAGGLQAQLSDSGQYLESAPSPAAATRAAPEIVPFDCGLDPAVAAPAAGGAWPTAGNAAPAAAPVVAVLLPPGVQAPPGALVATAMAAGGQWAAPTDGQFALLGSPGPTAALAPEGPQLVPMLSQPQPAVQQQPQQARRQLQVQQQLQAQQGAGLFAPPAPAAPVLPPPPAAAPLRRLPRMSLPLLPAQAQALQVHVSTLMAVSGCGIEILQAPGALSAEMAVTGTPPQLQSASVMISRLLQSAHR
jgi:hypothetical protein